MDEALEMLRDQLTGLLDISKLDARIVSAHRKPIDLVRFTHRLRDEFAPLAQQKQLQLVLDLPPRTCVHIDSDPLLLERMRNLLDNAIKYCDAGWSDCVCNRLNPAQPPEARWIIQDTGRGIPLARPRKSSKSSTSSTTLNAIAHAEWDWGWPSSSAWTQLLGIPMSLQSELGIGTQVTLTLPADHGPRRSTRTRSGSHRPLPSCHILVIDDEPSILMAMKSLLESHGCQVTAVATTDEAMQHAVQDRPDVVLADFRLRGQESGIKAIRKLRQMWARHAGAVDQRRHRRKSTQRSPRCWPAFVAQSRCQWQFCCRPFPKVCN